MTVEFATNYLKNLIFSASFLKKYLVGTFDDPTQNLVQNDPLPLGYPKIPKLAIWSICAALGPESSKKIPKLTIWSI